MHHVFVSYSRSDADWVAQLVNRLEAWHLTTWLDQRDIPPTLPWFAEIADAIVEADLFVICDSPASRESSHCSSEAQLAFDAAKRTVEIEVGANVERAAADIAQAMRELPEDYRLRTELAVRAQSWDRGGRERKALASRRLRRRLLRGAGVRPPLAAHELSFLRDSRSRSRRRIALSVFIGVVLTFSGLTWIVLEAAQKRIEQTNDEQAAAYVRTNAALERADDDPYVALSEASELGRTESGIDALIAQAGFAVRVPDDGFAVPPDARRFATPTVEDRVVVTDGEGSFWARPAAQRDRRTAQPVPPPGSAGGASAGSLRAHAAADSSVVEVFRDGVLWRRLVFSQPPAVLCFSPNGRELAAGGEGFAEIADLQAGKVRTMVSSMVGGIRDLAWSADGRRLWALGPKLVISWPVRDGRVLLDAPEERFEALLPAAEGSAVWAVSSDGELRQIAVADGRLIRRLRVPDELHAGAGAPDGTIAALSGARGLWIASLEDRSKPRLVQLPDCKLGRASLPDATTVYLPCISGKVLEISVDSGEVVGASKIGPAGAFAVKAIPRQSAFLASDTFAHLFVVPPAGEAREIYFSPCGGGISRIAISPSGTVVVPTGPGSGITGCHQRGLLVGDDPVSPGSWSFDAVNDAVESTLAETGAVSADGSAFALGYSDGTVVLHPTLNITPQRTLTSVIGEIRDMLVAPGDQLLIATSAGIVQRVDFCPTCLSNRSFAASARRLIRRGTELGTAKWVENASQEVRP